MFLLNFTGGLSSGKTHTANYCFVSGLYWYTKVLLSCYDVPNMRRPSIKFSQHAGAPIHPTPLLLFTQVMGHSMGTKSHAKVVVKNASETSRRSLQLSTTL